MTFALEWSEMSREVGGILSGNIDFLKVRPHEHATGSLWSVPAWLTLSLRGGVGHT